MSLSVRRRPLVAAVLAYATCLGLLTACSGPSDTGSSDGKAAAAGDGPFPVSLTTAWGRTEVKEKPVRVATVSDGDTSIALALGLVPVCRCFLGVSHIPQLPLIGRGVSS